MLEKQHGLNSRQAAVLAHLIETPFATIRDLEQMFSTVSRRTLQRDLAEMESKGLVVHSGETNQLNYSLSKDL